MISTLHSPSLGADKSPPQMSLRRAEKAFNSRYHSNCAEKRPSRVPSETLRTDAAAAERPTGRKPLFSRPARKPQPDGYPPPVFSCPGSLGVGRSIRLLRHRLWYAIGCSVSDGGKKVNSFEGTYFRCKQKKYIPFALTFSAQGFIMAW